MNFYQKNLIQQAPQVRVVQGGLDLVHDVEGRGPRPEDRDEERHRGQRPLPAAQQRQALDPLARRARLDLDAGGEHVVRIGEHEPPLAAGEEPVEDDRELAGRIGVGPGEGLLDAGVDLLDDAQQVVARRLEVRELSVDGRASCRERV